MTPSPRVAIVFGLAGCGKSTLARGIAETFGLRVIHPSGIMRDLMEQREVDLTRTRHNQGYWETEEGSRALDERLSHAVPVDVEANEILLAEVEKGEVVIDSWSLPWMTSLGVRIHLLASLAERSRRAALRAGIEQEAALELISAKDEGTRELFLRLYSFDIKADHRGRFHLTLDTEALSAEQVLSAACQELRDRWSTD